MEKKKSSIEWAEEIVKAKSSADKQVLILRALNETSNVTEVLDLVSSFENKLIERK